MVGASIRLTHLRRFFIGSGSYTDTPGKARQVRARAVGEGESERHASPPGIFTLFPWVVLLSSAHAPLSPLSQAQVCTLTHAHIHGVAQSQEKHNTAGAGIVFLQANGGKSLTNLLTLQATKGKCTAKCQYSKCSQCFRKSQEEVCGFATEE